MFGANAIYNNGPIQVGIGYELNKKVRGPDLDDSDITITGGYNLGIVRVAPLY